MTLQDVPTTGIIGQGHLQASAAAISGVDPIIAQRRAAAAARQKRSRARRRAGCAIYAITLTAAVLDALVRWRWVAEAEITDKQRVEAAVSEGLADAACHDEKFRDA